MTPGALAYTMSPNEFSLSRVRERVGVRAVRRGARARGLRAHRARRALRRRGGAQAHRATNTRLDQLQADLEARLGALEQQLKNQGLDLLREVEGIKSDVARIRGQIEVLIYELAEAQKRQRDLYVDLDSRMRKLEAAPGTAAAPPLTDAGAAAIPAGSLANAPDVAAARGAGRRPRWQHRPHRPAASEQRAYDAALDQFKRGDYPGAIAGFQAFVKTYPRSPLASSAQYWIGNAQFARKDYRAAIVAQRQLICSCGRTARRCRTRCSTSRRRSRSSATTPRRAARSRS